MRSTFVSIVSLVVMALSASAQQIEFLYPTPGQSLSSGENLSVQIGQPRELSGFTNAAIALGYESCDSTTACRTVSAEEGVWDVAEVSLFSPQSSVPYLPPYQNFSLALPADLSGTVLLQATLFYFGSASLVPSALVINTTVTIV